MDEFTAATGHMAFYTVLKLTHMSEPPWLLFQLAHHDQLLAHAACERLLESPTQHPRHRRLLQEPLRSQARLWLEGTDLMDESVAELCIFIAELRLVSTNDRPIEAQHAKTHRRGLSRPMHTTKYQSYGLRIAELERQVRARPSTISDFAALASMARNCVEAVLCVGLESHPVVQASTARRKDRDPALADVIYHADAWSLYTATPPPVDFVDDDGAPPVVPADRNLGPEDTMASILAHGMLIEPSVSLKST